MGATTLVSFDPNPEHLGFVKDYIAGGTIVMGSVVSFDDAATSDTVIAALSTVGLPVGVALNAATTGQKVTVAGPGSVLTVQCAATDTSIDAGHFVRVSTVSGTVLEFDPRILGHVAALSVGKFPIGIALEDSVAGAGTVGATVKILVKPCVLFCNEAT